MSKNKTRRSITVSSGVWEAAKAEHDSVSAHIENLLKQSLSHDYGEKPEIEQRIEEIEDEIIDKKSKIQSLKEDVSKLSAEKQGLREELREMEEKDAELERGIEVIEKQREENKWKEPSDINDYWPDATGLSKEELWEKAQ